MGQKPVNAPFCLSIDDATDYYTASHNLLCRFMQIPAFSF